VRLVICADGDVGLDALSFLADAHVHDIAMVVVTGDGPVRALAVARELPCHVWRDSAALVQALAAGHPIDIGLLAWWPHIIRPMLLTLPRRGFVNFHPSLLPYNRGKHYNFWAIVESCPFGVTIHRVDAGIDSGPVLFQKPIPYSWSDDGGTLFHKAQRAMKELFRESYSALRGGQYAEVPQDPLVGSLHFAKDIESASLIRLDDVYSARTLFNRLRARTFPGKPACTFTEDGRTWEVRISIQEKPPASTGKQNE